ncbi:hypothetical protein EVAR_35525_1 [Eumeta japonica]|uniref:Uncharacterized protein n=1 Tax=Eumeta variegata TaxID=151549 RepID=A0A4C1X4T3_EUMVA|nr:hypothetical protein EVAR_35525_1 [Eumeta japonica]
MTPLHPCCYHSHTFSILRSPTPSYSSTNRTAIYNGLSRTPRPRRCMIIKTRKRMRRWPLERYPSAAERPNYLPWNVAARSAEVSFQRIVDWRAFLSLIVSIEGLNKKKAVSNNRRCDETTLNAMSAISAILLF